LHFLNQRFDLCVGTGGNLFDFSMLPFRALFELIPTRISFEMSLSFFRRARYFSEDSLDAIHIAVEFSAFTIRFRGGGRLLEIDVPRLAMRQFGAQGIFQALKFFICHSSIRPFMLLVAHC
jgi:hypothetical protein